VANVDILVFNYSRN